MSIKIVVTVEGGVVTAVQCSDAQAEVIVVDFDTQDEESEKSMDELAAENTDLPTVY